MFDVADDSPTSVELEQFEALALLVPPFRRCRADTAVEEADTCSGACGALLLFLSIVIVVATHNTAVVEDKLVVLVAGTSTI